MMILETPRLILRTWEESDVEPMSLISADPKVMEFFPSTQSPEETKLFINKIQKHHATYG